MGDPDKIDYLTRTVYYYLFTWNFPDSTILPL